MAKPKEGESTPQQKKIYGCRPSEAWFLSYGLQIKEKVLTVSTLNLNEGCCMPEK
jgi:hypothetical protein